MSFIPIMPLSYYVEKNDYSSLEILNQHNIFIFNRNLQPVQVIEEPPIFEFEELPDLDLSIFDDL